MLEVGLESPALTEPAPIETITPVPAVTEAPTPQEVTSESTPPEAVAPEAPSPEASPPETTSAMTDSTQIGLPEVEIPTVTLPEVDMPGADLPEGTSEENCETLYQELLAQFGQDYNRCIPDAVGTATCPKPESLEGQAELKENINIELILDSSGSMAAEMEGQPKLEIAKEVLIGFVETLPETANVALRVYGHVGSNNEADKAVSCAGSELLYPFQTLDKAKFKTAINSFQATGWTPVAGSLQKAQEDFAQFDPETSSNFVYLVSDGIETCDGDPVAAARELYASDIKAVVNIIGFDVDPEAAQQLRAAAEQGGGQYYEAHSATELNTIFTETFNWQEWTNYYACVVRDVTTQAAAVTLSETEAYACVVQSATEEYSSITLESASDIAKYGACREYIQGKADSRYNSLIEAAEQKHREAVDIAQQEREQAIQEAEASRDQE
jgi:Ca-activated chloride channel family protein